MFTLEFKKLALRKLKKLNKKNSDLQSSFKNTFRLLQQDPKSPSLKSHKVTRDNGEKAFSSEVTRDIRVIWDYQNGRPNVLDILDIGGHSGKNKVYK